MLNNPRPGFNLTAEYQVSAIPWVTSSNVTGVKRHDFYKVTKFVVVKNNSGPGTLRVGFTNLGVQGSNYFELAAGESFAGDFRVKTVYLSSSANVSYSMLAGVTMIDASMMVEITGSINGTGSFDGVG